jgi:hypothetical protein
MVRPMGVNVRRRQVPRLLLAAAVGLALIGQPAHASDQRSRGSAISDPTVLATQSKLSDIVDDIRGLDGTDHYVDGAITGTSLIVYWYGTISSQVRARLTAATANGLAVSIKPAPFSPAALRATKVSIMKQAKRLHISLLVRQHGGLGFDVEFADAPSARAAASAMTTLSAHPSAIPSGAVLAYAPLVAKAGGPDIHLVAVPVTFTSLAGRQSDTPPFYSGGRLNGNSACTLGPPMHKGTGSVYVTAGHCVNFNDEVVEKSGGGLTIGHSVYTKVFESTGYDASFVSPNNAVSNALFDGNNVTLTTKTIIGDKATPTRGVSVCYSGATTGTACSYLVIDYATTMGGFDVTLTERSDHATPASGDSGSTVFQLNQSNIQQVYVQGVLVGKTSSYTMGYTEISDIKSVSGYSIGHA